MPYVQRDAEGNISGIYAQMQPGYAEEFVEDPEFPPPDLNAIDIDELNRALVQEGSIIRALAQAIFTLANDVRTLQGRPTITVDQFKTYLKGLMRT